MYNAVILFLSKEYEIKCKTMRKEKIWNTQENKYKATI